MSRIKGSPNKNPSFVSNTRIKAKANKLLIAINEFLELVERNRFAHAETDFNKWGEITDSLDYIINTEPDN